MHSESERGVEVKQADREAAAELLASRAMESIPAAVLHHQILEGLADDHVYVQAFARHRATNPTTGWRSDMENAPRDGTIIDLWIVCDGYGERHSNAYWGRPSHTCGEAGRYCDSCPSYDGWVDITFMQYLNGEDGMDGEPTHWMPLPPPPTTSPAGGEHVE